MKEDWAEVELGDAFDFIGGGTPSKKESSFWNGEIPWTSVKDVKGAILKKTSDFISEQGLNKSAANVARKGELIVATRIIPGRPILTEIDTAINQDLKIARPKIPLHIPFMYYSFLDNERRVLKESSGTTVLGIRLEVLRSIPLSLPPIPEQRAIVSKIEQLFSELDNGIANLKTAQQQLKVYRHSVLSTALEGLAETPIEDVLSSLSQGWSPKCINRNSTDPEEWAVIKTSAIQHGEFLPHENKILPTELEPRGQHEIEEGDILITRAGPRVRVGVCCLVKRTRKRLINCDKVYLLKLNRELILPEYFEALMNTPEYLKQIEKIKTGSSDSGLNLTQDRFKKLEIPLPKPSRQHQIVQEIESRLSVCDKLEESITQSLLKAEALRQSILKKAFEGRLLTETELAACKKENDWEPAGVLLGRVKGVKEI